MTVLVSFSENILKLDIYCDKKVKFAKYKPKFSKIAKFTSELVVSQKKSITVLESTHQGRADKL